MPKSVIADRKPMQVTLEPGEHYWCACGRSRNQPFCDGSHAGTGIEPYAFTIDEKQTAFLCMCKQTGNAPFCDGTHAKLPRDITEMDTPARSVVASKDTATRDKPEQQAQQDNKPPAARNTPEEPTVEYIHHLARHGLKHSAHGRVDAMGVPRDQLPKWEDIQLLTAQLDRQPLADHAPVDSSLTIGPNADKPLQLAIPLLVSDMSFGALSEEAKTALARGAEGAGTGICSGEGGALPEARRESSRYLYELASARFGYDEALLGEIQAFHFKAGQAAKTGTGGHLPGAKVTDKIAAVRGIPAGEDAISPSRFDDMTTPAQFKAFADHVRSVSGGIPIGFKMSAQHIEKDIDFALEASADYIILDGRGGGTGAAPLLFRDNISVPTIPALARARRHLRDCGREDVTLIITGGIRTPADFIKALCLGADGIALANSAIQAVGCVGARMCHTNNCPTGVATQKPELRARLKVDDAAQQLTRFFESSVQLMQLMARACGHERLADFNADDLTTWKRDMAELTGIAFAGV